MAYGFVAPQPISLYFIACKGRACEKQRPFLRRLARPGAFYFFGSGWDFGSLVGGTMFFIRM
jgi:hypothetical protein